MKGINTVVLFCKNHLAYFNPYPQSISEALKKHGYIHSLASLETANVQNYSCPLCGADDRSRLYAIYLSEKFKKIEKIRKYKFIDFAPSTSLSKFIRQYKLIQYRSADLFMEGVDDKVDITNMAMYGDSSFDIFLCSHVLEHVDNDKKVMKELYRILKPGGWGIAMTPIDFSLEDVYENHLITNSEERWKHFGQDDHVRLYSKSGFIKRLAEAGFTVKQFDIDFFGKAVFEKNGIHPHSVLYIVEK